MSSKPWSERKNTVKSNVRAALDSGDIDALMDALPPLQKEFAEEYIKDYNGKQAVERTNSTTEYPERLAYIWLNNPGVKAYIKHLCEQRTEQLRIDQGYVIDKLVKTLEKAEKQGNHQAVLRAAELLAKHLGMLTERQEITGKDGGAIQYEKIKEDADAFTRSIASLIKRGRTPGIPLYPDTSTDGGAEVELEVLGETESD